MPLVDALRLDRITVERERRMEFPPNGLLVHRARVALEPRDRVLVELACEKNLSLRQISAILGRPAGSLSRRLNRLRETLQDPIVAALVDSHCVLTPEYRQLGLEYFAQRREIRELAKARQMTPTQIRAVLNFVRGWYRGVQRRS